MTTPNERRAAAQRCISTQLRRLFPAFSAFVCDETAESLIANLEINGLFSADPYPDHARMDAYAHGYNDATDAASAAAGSVTISLETLRDWQEQAEAIAASYGRGDGLSDAIMHVIAAAESAESAESSGDSAE